MLINVSNALLECVDQSHKVYDYNTRAYKTFLKF